MQPQHQGPPSHARPYKCHPETRQLGRADTLTLLIAQARCTALQRARKGPGCVVRDPHSSTHPQARINRHLGRGRPPTITDHQMAPDPYTTTPHVLPSILTDSLAANGTGAKEKRHQKCRDPIRWLINGGDASPSSEEGVWKRSSPSPHRSQCSNAAQKNKLSSGIEPPVATRTRAPLPIPDNPRGGCLQFSSSPNRVPPTNFGPEGTKPLHVGLTVHSSLDAGTWPKDDEMACC